MHTRPPGLDDAEIVASLRAGWGIEAADLGYLPQGLGSYHWVATDGPGRRWVVTVDDLTEKTWLGNTDDEAFEGLRTRFEVATAVRERAGLSWVVGPVRGRRAGVVARLTERYSIAVFPYVEGITPTALDGQAGRDERTELITMLAALHASAPLVPEVPRHDPAIPELESLLGALRDLDRPWGAGPFSEPARLVLAERADTIATLIATLGRLAQGVVNLVPVLTHGEPHAGNVVRSGEGHLVVLDWDTVALAPPERDLWMLGDGTGAGFDLYADLTGRAVDPMATMFYGLRWDLQDIALFSQELQEPHEENDDTRVASVALQRYVEGLGKWDHLVDTL